MEHITLCFGRSSQSFFFFFQNCFLCQLTSAHSFFLGQVLYQVFAESGDENANDNPSDDLEAKDDHLSKEGTDIAKPMPVSNKTSSNDDVVTSSKTGKDPEGEKDQTSSSDISEDMIKEAIEKRGSYFRKNSEYVSSTSRCM